MKTKAAILYKTNTPLRVEELIIPSLKAGQVLMKVAYSGVCHSQLNEVRGLKGEDHRANELPNRKSFHLMT